MGFGSTSAAASCGLWRTRGVRCSSSPGSEETAALVSKTSMPRPSVSSHHRWVLKRDREMSSTRKRMMTMMRCSRKQGVGCSTWKAGDGTLG
ncbi:unnamed protein product [Ectocarpus sp. 12 AP-2014]